MGTWNRADKDRAADLWAPTLPFLFVVDTLLVRWIKSALIEFNGISSGCLAGIQISSHFTRGASYTINTKSLLSWSGSRPSELVQVSYQLVLSPRKVVRIAIQLYHPTEWHKDRAKKIN